LKFEADEFGIAPWLSWYEVNPRVLLTSDQSSITRQRKLIVLMDPGRFWDLISYGGVTLLLKLRTKSMALNICGFECRPNCCGFEFERWRSPAMPIGPRSVPNFVFLVKQAEQSELFVSVPPIVSMVPVSRQEGKLRLTPLDIPGHVIRSVSLLTSLQTLLDKLSERDKVTIRFRPLPQTIKPLNFPSISEK
jgi:hypothetical protein